MRAEFVIKFQANLPGIAYRLRDNKISFVIVNYILDYRLN